MKNAVFLSYKGLGANLLHLSYCHQIAKRFGPVDIITLSNKLGEVVESDPLIGKVIFLDKFYKKFIDVYKLSLLLKSYNFDRIFIFYPSLRLYLAAKLAKINNIFIYPLLKKKNLHLVKAAKDFTENALNIKNCPTETNLYIDDTKKNLAKSFIKNNKKNIIIGVGSSGPTTRWGMQNYLKLLTKLKSLKECFFLILGGPNDFIDVDKIVKELGEENSISLCKLEISQIAPIISISDLYIGNDSFGHHISCQNHIPSIVLLLDTPSAYSEYSLNQHQILPPGISAKNINHNSTISPDQIDVDVVLNKALNFLS